LIGFVLDSKSLGKGHYINQGRKFHPMFCTDGL
jgi:hypothetical protein